MKNRKNYTSLNTRFVAALALCTILPLLICSFFFQSYEREKALEEYIDRSKVSMTISSKNIEHYLKTSISSTKNIYIDFQVLSLLSSGSPQDFISRDLEGSQQIFSFMQGIYNVTPDAAQIRLISNRLNKSFLLITGTLQKSLMSVGVSEMKLPEFSRPTDVYLEPTHTITSYGHTVHYSSGQTRNMQVFTIWLPVFRLDSSNELLAILAIDMPISFIETNCQSPWSTAESIFVVDQTGNIIAGSVDENAGSDISDHGVIDFLSNAPDSFSFSSDPINYYLQTGFNAKYIPWKIVKVVSRQSIYQDINNQMQFLLVIFACSVFFATILNSITVLHFTSPLRKATAYMKDVKRSPKGTTLQLSDYVEYKKQDELKILFDSLEEMMDSIENHTIREYKLELLNQNTLLKMLQAQINPHFVYNTLQCLATHALKDQNVEQYDYISALGHMMHYAMDLSVSLSPIKDEEIYVTNYYDLQKMRFSSDSLLLLHSDEVKNCLIPKMTLQPLIENCIYHGNIFKKPSGWVQVDCSQQISTLILQVIDNGIPISSNAQNLLHENFMQIKTWFTGLSNSNDPHQLFPNEMVADGTLSLKQLNSGLHIGIGNVYKRLLLNFGPNCSIQIFPNEFGGTTVKIQLPAITPQEKGD